MKRFLVLAALLVALPLHAQDQQPSDASLRELFVVMKTRQLLDNTWGQIDASMRQMVREAAPGELTREQQKVLDDMATQAVVIFREEMSWERMEPVFADIYRKSLTQFEVDGMIEFYKSPAGKALIEKMPAVMQNTMAVMTDKIGDVRPRLLALQKETLKKFEAAK